MEPEFSLELPSIFPLFTDSHKEAPSIEYMGAAALLRKLHSDADMCCASESVRLADGTWVLRGVDQAVIATVSPQGVVSLVTPVAPAAPGAVFVRKESVITHGIEVEESNPEPGVMLAEVRITTIWRCSNSACAAKWSKSGNHINVVKRCRACGRETHLRGG
jgi:hypothetical protein